MCVIFTILNNFANIIIISEKQIIFSRFQRVILIHIINLHLRLQVLSAASLKRTAFWDIGLCSLVEVDGSFRGADNGGSKHF
jgi:hypothetical protein